jgi:hypothetical protein
MFLKLLARTWLALSIAMAITAGALAAEDAKSIMTKSRELRKGFTNSVADVKMTLYARGDRTAIRAMRQYVLEVKREGNRTINVFSKPADVSGVSLLTHSALNGDDKQWLFLPSIRRVKRISSSNRSGAFVGSEFAYEDLSSFEVEKYSYKGVDTETLDGRKVFVVDYSPQYKNSAYSRLRAYLDPSNYQPVRIDYFNRRGEHFKTLTPSNYRAYKGDRAWRPHRLEMKNLVNGKSTTINFSPFKPSEFTAAGFDYRRFQNAR